MAPCLAANQFLLDAVKAAPAPRENLVLADLAPVDRMLEVCLRLNTRNLMGQTAR